jgi:hypothetical protein
MENSGGIRNDSNRITGLVWKSTHADRPTKAIFVKGQTPDRPGYAMEAII